MRGLFTLIYAPRYSEWLVLETGVDRPGDMARLTHYIKPDCVVVTRFGDTPAHLEFFPSRAALIKEKSLLVSALKKEGFLVVNMDDVDAYGLRKETSAKIITYGTDANALFRVSYAAIAYRKENNFPEGILAKLEYDGKMIPFSLTGTIGLHYISSALAAFAVGDELGVNLLAAVGQLKALSFPPGRMNILEGIRNTVIIDDSYNSSPVALVAALRAFKELTVSGRKIIVLGDMLELGAASDNEHRKAGECAAETADYLVTVGVRARFMRDGALGKGMSAEQTRYFGTSTEAGAFLKEFAQKGDAILIKGSQGVRMEKAVAPLLAHPQKQKELLVRQEKEWTIK
ncbi:MAG: UDP-N-acetylmuramoyl-tripeptide--D-alanyl-D-alanine ligase [Parcubacteria group bacterium]|nr:UDP-N-acetylmuramoyl-tripeptide--D-alanyl-D-alanine ligase [Parcubacteria group bacterium]